MFSQNGGLIIFKRQTVFRFTFFLQELQKVTSDDIIENPTHTTHQVVFYFKDEINSLIRNIINKVDE